VTDASFAQGLIGVTLDGRYRLDAVLGEGGMGSVFRATQLAMDRKVAIKLLKPHLTSDDAALQRFAREARATQKVESPHAVKILDFGVTPLRDYYMVLEYLDGRSVQRELEIDGPFAPARVAHIARQALHALGVAHDLGLIHRDVKPDNLLLMRVGSDADYTKILDFGVAKLMQGAADPSQLALTAAGMVFGTPEFMSPEQACGQALDGRSDLYSLAVTMFVMLTGNGLFEGKSAIEWLTHHARTPAPRLAMVRPELLAYPELDDLLQRCLAKQREQRPQRAAEMAALLAELAPTLTRPPGAAPPRLATDPGPGDRPATALAAGVTPPARPLASPTALRRTFHESSYFHALRDTDPSVPVAASTTGAAVSSGQMMPAVPRSRRGLYLWLGGVAIAALIGAVIGISIRTSTSRSASMSANGAHTGTAGAPIDADPIDAGPGDGSVVVDAVALDASLALHAPVHAPAPPVAAIRGLPAARKTEAEEHLRGAEDGLRSNNRLKQLAEADLALQADPSSVRAKYLFGDALIKGGVLERGCAYLHAIKRYAPAREGAHAAGCPGD
jgi:eukaryotic-like serine/threonine-protein kinase